MKPGETEKSAAPTLRGQWLTCLLLCVLAAAVMARWHLQPVSRAFLGGWSMPQQLAVAIAFAGVVAYSAVLVLSVSWLRKAVPVPAALQGLDLSGSRPLQVALAAALGEELFFRAALQPLVGLWPASALFALAHARTSALGGSWAGRAALLAQAMAGGLLLGLVYRHIGLFAAIGIHAAIDAVTLTSLQKLKLQTASAS